MKFGRIFLLLILFFLLLTPVTVLQIRAPKKEDRLVWVGRVSPGDGIETVYIHSVEKSPVHEYFRIGEKLSFHLKETTFSSCNTGLPVSTEGNERFINDRGTFRLTGMNRVLPGLSLWVHEDYGNVLKLGTRSYIDLPSLAGNTLLVMTLRRMPLVLWGFEEVKLFARKP